MAKRIKLVILSVVVAILLALASSAAVSGWAVAVDSSFPGVMEMIADPSGGGGSAS